MRNFHMYGTHMLVRESVYKPDAGNSFSSWDFRGAIPPWALQKTTKILIPLYTFYIYIIMIDTISFMYQTSFKKEIKMFPFFKYILNIQNL